MINKWIGIGNLCNTPEIRHTKEGYTVANFSLACNEKWKNKNGERQERVEFVRIVAFRRLAEICAEYLTKGQLVFLEGKLQTKEWEDKNGIKRQTTEVIVHNMQMLGGGKKADHAPPATEPDDVPF